MKYLVASNLNGQIAMYEFKTKKDQAAFMKQAKQKFGDDIKFLKTVKGNAKKK
jgi:phage gp36-like protein